MIDRRLTEIAANWGLEAKDLVRPWKSRGTRYHLMARVETIVALRDEFNLTYEAIGAQLKMDLSGVRLTYLAHIDMLKSRRRLLDKISSL